ncbi:MAG: hypothetical protein KC996_09290 [Phycisphaerales bacterium]|nr:hypothetical protein [Phycisphaerales bacterium]
MNDEGEPIIITTASEPRDIDQIIYGLYLRGVRAEKIPSKVKGSDRFDIVIDPRFAFIAHEAIDPIWDAILEDIPRAVTLDGMCAFCGYDVRSLPRPTVCPECGVNLDSHEARRALRDGKPVKKKAPPK